MILPLSLLKCAQNSAILLELKSGDTYNGHMVAVDNLMNIHLRDAICTSKDGDIFHRVPEILIRGTSIKVFRVAPETVDKLKEENKNLRANQKQNRQFKKQLNRGAAMAAGGGGGTKRKAEDGSDVPYKANRGNGGNRGRGGRGRGR
uniref:U6 snRNA-associated Sm-like protein LSm4 n=1 Tax=Panagrolaimus sp. JU765 TaxID=591449 RepID=A0AC34RQI7_9BILA